MTTPLEAGLKAVEDVGAHTPGPWSFSDHGDRRHKEFAIMAEGGANTDCGRGKIASVYAGFGAHFTWEQAEANARIMTAAPDLLRALENLLEDAITLGIKESDVSGSAIEARDAIRKARGAK